MKEKSLNINAPQLIYLPQRFDFIVDLILHEFYFPEKLDCYKKSLALFQYNFAVKHFLVGSKAVVCELETLLGLT